MSQPRYLGGGIYAVTSDQKEAFYERRDAIAERITESVTLQDGQHEHLEQLYYHGATNDFYRGVFEVATDKAYKQLGYCHGCQGWE